ncbi:MAG TPA: AMP-binding protein [Acidimicrobiales bacterium]|nr:AMP-binding protein [Acidimicrobiales bacterium]
MRIHRQYRGVSGSANLAEVLATAAAVEGATGRAAYLVGDRVFTHGDVHDGAARTATLLARAGVGRGDRVLLVVPDGIEFVWAFLGGVRLGAIVVPVNPRLTLGDHRQMLEVAGAKVVVSGAELAARFEGRAGVVVAEDLEHAKAGAQPHPAVEVDGGDPAYAQFTSGTTGAPKAAVHRHADARVYFEAFARPAAAIGSEDTLLSVSKMFFAYGLGNSLFFPLFAGCRAVLHPGSPRPGDVAALVRCHGVTVLFSVPTFYARLLGGDDGGEWGSLRAAVSAGETLAVALAERIRQTLGCPVLDGLGSTEVGQTFVSNTLEHQRDGTVGRPLPPYSVAVRDADEGELPPGAPGTLWVRGPTVLVEYLGRPDATAAVKRGEWLCTGDRAAVEPDGFVRHHGRMDDMEIVGGINVGPLEIEAVLSRHPAVMEVAVVAVRDELGASRLEAFVVPTAGAAPHADIGEELVSLARAELAPYKVPRLVRFVDALPRTPTGKLRRFVLRSGTWPPTAAG